MSRTVSLFFGVFVCWALSACGYRFGYSSRALPGGYEQVAIPVFKNATSHVAIEPFFTNALKEEFERSKVARIADKSVAPVVLLGTITNITIARGALVSGGSEIARLPKNTAIATEYRILAQSQLELVRASDQKVLWVGNFQNEIVYSAPRIGTEIVNSANANYNSSIFQQKMAELSQIMMEEAHDRVTENF